MFKSRNSSDLGVMPPSQGFYEGDEYEALANIGMPVKDKDEVWEMNVHLNPLDAD